MKKSTLPVSRKFYDDMRKRVSDSFSNLDPRLLYSALATIDLYLMEGVTPNATTTDPTVMLMFSLLRPEIDKAISRSSRARERSSKRKDQSTKAENADVMTESQTEDSQRPLLNRHMRRLIEQERRRASRMKIKPLYGQRQELRG